MPNPIIQNYFNDNSIPYGKRAKAFQDIESGTLNEDQFAQGLTQHFGDKYSTQQNQPQSDNQQMASQGQTPQPNQNLTSQQDHPLGIVGDAVNAVGKSATDLVGNFVKPAVEGIQTMGQGVSNMAEGTKEAFGQGKVINPNGAAQGRPWEALPTPGFGTPDQMVKGSQKTFGGLEDIIRGSLGTAFSPVSGAINSIPEEHIKQGITALAGAPSWAISSLGKWAAKQANPSLSEDQLHELVGKPLETATNVGLTAFAPEAAEAVGKVAGKAGEVAGNVVKGSGEVAKSALAMTSGLGKGAIESALENPETLAEAQKIGIEGSRNKTLDMLKNPIDTKIKGLNQKVTQGQNNIFDVSKNMIDKKINDLSETGTGYKAIRESETPINLADKNGNSWFEKFVQSKGLNIEDGKILSDKGSAIRNPAEISRLQGLYDNYGKYTKFTPSEFLNFRQDVGDLAKFGEGISNNMTGFAKDFYNKLNETGRPQIAGLEKIDTEFSPLKQSLKNAKDLIYDKEGNVKPDAFNKINNQLIKQDPNTMAALKQVIPNFDRFMETVGEHQDTINNLQSIKKILYNDNGSLKDNAVSNVNNLLNKGKEGLIGKIQENLPDFDIDKFARQVKVTKALEDIELAKGNKFATYGKGGAFGGALATGNIPLMTGLILSHPSILIPILQKAGETAGLASDFVTNISNKIMEGEKPIGEAARFVTKALKQVKPKFIQSLVSKAATPNQQ